MPEYTEAQQIFGKQVLFTKANRGSQLVYLRLQKQAWRGTWL